MFLTKPYKIVPFSKRQNQPEKKNNSFIFHIRLYRLKSGSKVSLTPSKSSLPGITLGASGARQAVDIDKNIFSPKSAEKYERSAWAGKTMFLCVYIHMKKRALNIFFFLKHTRRFFHSIPRSEGVTQGRSQVTSKPPKLCYEVGHPQNQKTTCN